MLLGDSGTGKSHLLIAMGIAACEAGRRVRYVTCASLVNELAEAADDRLLSNVVARFGRLDLLLVDELGYVSVDPKGAELLFQLLTEREERASVYRHHRARPRAGTWLAGAGAPATACGATMRVSRRRPPSGMKPAGSRRVSLVDHPLDAGDDQVRAVTVNKVPGTLGDDEPTPAGEHGSRLLALHQDLS